MVAAADVSARVGHGRSSRGAHLRTAPKTSHCSFQHGGANDLRDGSEGIGATSKEGRALCEREAVYRTGTTLAYRCAVHCSS